MEEKNIKKVCPRCHRDYYSSTVTCPICKCLVLTQKEFDEYIENSGNKNSKKLRTFATTMFKTKIIFCMVLTIVALFSFAVMVTLSKYWLAIGVMAMAFLIDVYVIAEAYYQREQSDAIAQMLENQSKILENINEIDKNNH